MQDLENAALQNNTHHFHTREHQWQNLLSAQAFQSEQDAIYCAHCKTQVSQSDYEDFSLEDGTCLCEQCNYNITNNSRHIRVTKEEQSLK